MFTERRLPSGAVLWRSTGGAPTVIPADGCSDVIVLDGRWVVAGPSTRALTTRADGAAGSIGLRLAPGQAGLVLRRPMTELTDELVPLDAVVSRGRAAMLRCALSTVVDPPWDRDGSRGNIDALTVILSDDGPDRAWTAAVRRWAARQVSTAVVTDRLGVSERTLRRRMTESFGYGYPTLTRLTRAQRARSLLLQSMSPVDVAAAAGYADQPHLTREFRRFVGRSPGQVASGAKKSIALPSGSRNVA